MKLSFVELFSKLRNNLQLEFHLLSSTVLLHVGSRSRWYNSAKGRSTVSDLMSPSGRPVLPSVVKALAHVDYELWTWYTCDVFIDFLGLLPCSGSRKESFSKAISWDTLIRAQ